MHDEAVRKAEQDKLNKEKARKLQKAEIDFNNLASKIEEFESIINAIKPSEELSDHEVKDYMINISK